MYFLIPPIFSPVHWQFLRLSKELIVWMIYHLKKCSIISEEFGHYCIMFTRQHVVKFGLGTGDQPDTDGATYSTFPYGVNYTIFCVSKKQRIVLKSWMNENSIKALLLFRSTKICRQYSIKKQHLIWGPFFFFFFPVV